MAVDMSNTTSEIATTTAVAMPARRPTRLPQSTFPVLVVVVVVAVAGLAEGRPQAAVIVSAVGQPVGASITNGTVSFAAKPPSETVSVSPAGSQLAEQLANSPPIVTQATSGGGEQLAKITGMPQDTQQLARQELTKKQQHERAVGAIEKALLGIPRTIPDDEALQRLGEHLEAQAAAQRKKEKEKFSARIIKGWGFGGGGFLIG